MSFLGSVGSLYMLILIFLLVIGFGLTGFALVRFVTGPKVNKADKRQNNAYEKNGGFKFMNSWLRLALFSFVAILISMAVLAFVSPGGLMGNNVMNPNMYYGNIPMQNGMPMNQNSGGMGMMSMPMGNMQMQSAPMTQSTGSMPVNNTQMNTNSMMQMLNQMQMQLNQMQQQLQQMNMGGGSMPAPASGGGMGMM